MATRRVKRIKRTKKHLQHGRRKTNRRRQTNRHRYTRRQRGGDRTIVEKTGNDFFNTAKGIRITQLDSGFYKIGNENTLADLQASKGSPRYKRAFDIITKLGLNKILLGSHEFIAFSALYCKDVQDPQCDAIMAESKRLIRDELNDAINAMSAFPTASADIRTMAVNVVGDTRVNANITRDAKSAERAAGRDAGRAERAAKREINDAVVLKFMKPDEISYPIGEEEQFVVNQEERLVSIKGVMEPVDYDDYVKNMQDQLRSGNQEVFQACIQNVIANKDLPAEERANTTCFAPDLLTHRLACKTIIQKIGTNMGIDPTSDPSKDETGYFIQFMYPSQPVAVFFKIHPVPVKVYVHIDYSLGLYDVFLRFVFNENTICPSFYFIFVHFFQQITLCFRTGKCALKKTTVENFQMRDGYFIQFAIQNPKELFSEKKESIITQPQIQSQISAAQKTLKELKQRQISVPSQKITDNVNVLEAQLASMTLATGTLRCPSYIEAVTNCLLTFCIETNQLCILPPDDKEFDCLGLKPSPWSQHLKVDLVKENSVVMTKIDEIKKRFSALQIQPQALKDGIASAIQRQQQQQPQQPQQSRQPRPRQPQKGHDGTEMIEFVPTGKMVEFDTSDASADVLSSAYGDVSGADVSGAAVPASDKANGSLLKNFVKVNPIAHDVSDEIFSL